MSSTTSLSQQLTNARLMAEGLKKRIDVVSKVGITETRATDIETLMNIVATLDNEQEALKAQLKSKTAELMTMQKQLQDLMSETKKLVKIAAEKPDWGTFGINDKK